MRLLLMVVLLECMSVVAWSHEALGASYLRAQASVGAGRAVLDAAVARQLAVVAPKRPSFGPHESYEDALLVRIVRHLPNGGSPGLRAAMDSRSDIGSYIAELAAGLTLVPSRERHVIFLADENESEPPSRELGQIAHDLGFELNFVYVDRSPAEYVRVGKGFFGPTLIRVRYIPPEYREAASRSGGMFYTVVTSSEIDEALAELGKRIGR